MWCHHEFLVEDEICRAGDDRNRVIGEFDRPLTAFFIVRKSAGTMRIIIKDFGQRYLKFYYVDRSWKYPADIQLE